MLFRSAELGVVRRCSRFVKARATCYYFRDFVAAILLVLLLSSCASQQPTPHDYRVRRRTDLEGRSLFTVLDRVGNRTILDRRLRASDRPGELYMALESRFPQDDPASRNVFIREVRWRTGDWYLAVFCTRERGTWMVFSATEWHKDIEF